MAIRRASEENELKNLRTQLLVSHMLLVVMLVAVMAGAVASFFHLGLSIDRILRNNYASVVAAQHMKEALSQLNGAAGLCMAGACNEGIAQSKGAATGFLAASNLEAHNITEPGEQEYSNALVTGFPSFRANLTTLMAQPAVLSAGERALFYKSVVQPEYRKLLFAADGVLQLNQSAILRANDEAKAEAERASYTSVGVTVASLACGILLVWWTVVHALRPLRTLAGYAAAIGTGHYNQQVVLHRTDEIGTLATAFNEMAARLQVARKREAERLRIAETMSDAALENLYDPVIVADKDARFVHLNPAAEGLFGSAGSLKGALVAGVLGNSPISTAIDRAINSAFVPASEDDEDYFVRSTADNERIYRIRVTPMLGNGHDVLGAVAVLEDVTHLRQLDSLKSEFIGVASHELRTPVTSLMLSVQLLLEGAVGTLSAAQHEVVMAQQEDIQRLERMTRDLLDITRLEAGTSPPRYELLSVQSVVAEAVARLSARASAEGVALNSMSTTSDGNFQADAEQLTRVLVNILDNAVRHTPRGGRVDINAEADDTQVIFTISDTGEGIPAEYIDRIFQRFSQVPGTTSGGSGLGLSIAQTIVHRHGGEISVKSSPGAGAKFTIRLPRYNIKEV